MHYFEKLPILTALSTLIAASVASPAPAPASAEGQPAITKMIVTMSTVNKWRTTIGETPEIGAPVDSAESGLVGNLYEYTKGCNGNSPPTGASVLDIVILGAPGSYACIPVPAGWTMKALEFEDTLADCYVQTWSSSNCGGPTSYPPSNECYTIPYAAVSVTCPSYA